MKYPEDFINKVICGDCLEVMKQIPDKTIDLVLTDPPYGLDGEESFDLTKEAIKECQRISRTQLVFLDWRNGFSVDDGKWGELVWEYGWVSG